MSRVCFADVDGVLNFDACFTEAAGPAPIDPECIERLNQVMATTGAELVLSSAWRGIRELEARLARAGALRHRYPADWRTPKLPGARLRGEEIAAWLERHPEVDGYAIVDDDSDMLPRQRPGGGRRTPRAVGAEQDCS